MPHNPMARDETYIAVLRSIPEAVTMNESMRVLSGAALDLTKMCLDVIATKRDVPELILMTSGILEHLEIAVKLLDRQLDAIVRFELAQQAAGG